MSKIVYLIFDMKRNKIPEKDEALWSEFISGNDVAFKAIYNSNVHHLFQYGCHFTSNEDLVKDCIHDLFIDLHHYRSRLTANVNIRGYLMVSLKRKIIKNLEKERKLKSIEMLNIPFYFSIITGESLDEEEEAQKTERLEKALQELSFQQREAIYLRFVSELSYDELCCVLHVNYQVARNLIYRGVEKLRKNLSDKFLILFSFLTKNGILKEII